MTELTRTILQKYQIRKSPAEKQAFIQLLRQYYPELRLQEGGPFKSRNIIIGDVGSAKVLLCAHYDTCARLLLPNFIMPKNIPCTLLYGLLMVIPILAGVFLVNVVLALFTSSFALHYLLSLITYFALLLLMLMGPANRHNANDNTSGVAVLCQLLAAMTPEERAKTAVIFFDNEEKGLLGSAMFRKSYKKQLNDKLVINFDCVGDGSYLMLGISKETRKIYAQQLADSFTGDGQRHFLFEKLERLYYPSDQSGFKTTVAVAALKRNPVFGYYMDRIHTDRDTEFDEKNIRLLCDGVRALLQRIL